MITFREALMRGADQLSANPALREDGFRDATLLLIHSLGISRATLIAHPERRVDREQQAAYQGLLERRLRFEPMQYILGSAEFWKLTLKVTPAVLIPRPETETLVEAVLARLPAARELRVVDVGTGSGAIALALASERPRLSVTAIDLSSEALAVARENARSLGLEGRIRFRESDLLEALEGEPPYDAVVANPPYIPAADAATLHAQVRDFEPALALFAGERGLDVYERLLPAAAAALKPGGLLALEIGFGQQDALAALLAPWHDVRFVDDLQGIPRVALAYTPLA